MIEWLTGDPFNGIVISITFFISVILGKELRKSREVSGKFIDSRIRIIASFFFIISITFMDHWYIPIFIAAFCFMFAIIMDAAKDYFKKLTFPVVLASFIVIIQAFSYGSDIFQGNFQFSHEGFDYGLLIFSRVIASVSVLILLIVTTTEAELFETMRWLKIPGSVIEISSFMKRYTKTFSAEGAKLKMAHESRCGSSRHLAFSKRIKNTSVIAGSLIIRAFSKSEEVYNAMLSRGWAQGSHFEVNLPSLKSADLFIGILLITAMSSLVILDGFL